MQRAKDVSNYYNLRALFVLMQSVHNDMCKCPYSPGWRGAVHVRPK